MSKKFSFTALIVSILIISILFYAGFYFVKNSNLVNIPFLHKADRSYKYIPLNNLSVTSENSFSASMNSFGFNTFQQLFKTDSNKNIFISPTSLALALQTTLNGAGTTTREEMKNVLSVQGMKSEELNKANLDLINSLNDTDSKVEINIANSLWTRKDVVINQDFINTSNTYFKSVVNSVDFNDLSTIDVINDWVNKNTRGKINSIISPPIPSDALLYIINAIYFKGVWQHEFNKNKTRTREFTSYNNQKSMVPMMEQSRDDFAYFETESFQAVSLPYGLDNHFSMLVFLPKKGSLIFSNDFDSFIKNLKQQQWENWIHQFDSTEGTVVVPKFNVKYSTNLARTLTSLGMGASFSDNADFEGIFHKAKISDVLHKTYIEVDEEGTEAAAVSEVGLSVGAAPGMDVEKKTFSMVVDRPFFYAIRDNQNEALLFMGVIQEL